MKFFFNNKPNFFLTKIDFLIFPDKYEFFVFFCNLRNFFFSFEKVIKSYEIGIRFCKKTMHYTQEVSE